MKVLILGASGATGKLVVLQLIKRQINIRILVRETAFLSLEIRDNPLIEIEWGNVSEYSALEMHNLLQDCTAIVSCLGHNITPRGLFGNPRNLVSDSVKNICGIVKEDTGRRIKLILMSTTAYTNTPTGEINSWGERIVFSLLKLLLPPHRDNVLAADYLVNNIGILNEHIEWVAVRPDTLVNEDIESPYEIKSSSVRSPIFDAGTTSRINVSHFMAELLMNESLWQKWQGNMPVVYNEEVLKVTAKAIS